jgi:putative hydrolase of HD superfamily
MNETTPNKALLARLLLLKDVKRAGWVHASVTEPESVAAHSWAVATLVMALCPSNLDRARAIEIALAHDIPEIITGDITPRDGISRSEKQALEQSAATELFEGLPEHMRERWLEYDEGLTPESVFVHAVDKLDMALQAEHYSKTQGVDTSIFIESALAKLPEGVLRSLIG